ncbi:DNRLRE domain-containing protein [Zobellia galactanivorans]|uniref:CBM96 family carbohydrate-binding protein n=1 Tax=Zobellia galactanivorans (strain DSM 12802 / CCUG 47099 / CIP 106680 / NCIMB 13871 / Dsij) TaxID=63186 RepID=UPI0026E1E680|nr:DNRLRE domain-containing protein [Zobellia galactanivorans]MDO6807916.1 DNRLRE domain-containing protein [Zobellia galactanivorans]
MKKITLAISFLLSLFFSFSQENLSGSDIILFPNTASTDVNLVLPIDMAPTDISIFNLTGRLIRKIPLNIDNVYNIDLGGLTQGMYLIAISSNTGTQVKKFIIDPQSMNSSSYYNPSNKKILNKVSATASINTGTKSIDPIDDAYIQGNTRYNTSIMKVYTSWRSSYFKFNLNSIQGKITSAKLNFTIDSDQGSGLIEVYKGSSTDWTEENLSSSNKPEKNGNPIGTTNGVHGMGKRVSIDLDVNKLGSSILNLIMVQPDGTNDFAFASKEHGSIKGPELLITYERNNNDTTEDDENYTTTGNNLIPLDDAFLQRSTRNNSTIMKVYADYRSSYLKFDLSSVPRNFTGAKLKFTIDSDAGSGEIQVYKGDSTDWTEENLSSSNKPEKSGNYIGNINGTYAIGKRISIDLDVSKLGNSLVSLIMVQPDGTNDFAFASKEHPTKAPPELVFTYGSADKSPTEGNPAEFELYFHDMQVLLDMQDALSFYSNAKRKEWLEKQEEVFKNEINRQLGTDHTSFSDAQQDFFKNYEKNYRKTESRAAEYSLSYNSTAIEMDKEQLVFTEELYHLEEWKLNGKNCVLTDNINFGGFSQPASEKCQRLFNTIIRGKTLKSLGSGQLDGAPSTTFSELRNEVIIDFSNLEYESAQNKSWAQGMSRIIEDGSLLNTMTNNHLDYYDRKGLEDKVFLMTTYLVQYNNRNLGLLQQPLPQYPLPIFSKKETLLEMGKEKAPALEVDELIFSPDYISEVLGDCAIGNQRPNGQQGPDNRDCAKVKQDLLDLKEQVIDEHISETSRLRTIEDYLINNPYGLLQIDCNQIENWKSLASHNPPQEIKSKIEDLQNNHEAQFGDWNIQYLNEAGGAIINMDYFAVNINEMPINPNTNERFSQNEFLNYFRRNINDFVDNTTFEPYCELSELCNQETDLWNQENPLGAIIKLDISLYGGPGGNILANDGVVMVSEFNDGSYWRFITLEAPYDSAHPVTGTRQFGIEQLSDGSYNIYVRGVDRFSSRFQELGATAATLGEPFLFADNLWQSFQNKTNVFINSNGGKASIKTPIHNRPDWDDVKDVLEGRRPITDLGCD